MTLTDPQRRFLGYAVDEFNRWGHSVSARGAKLRVAEALERKGLVTLSIGGSGVAYKAPWWYQATPTDAGRALIADLEAVPPPPRYRIWPHEGQWQVRDTENDDRVVASLWSRDVAITEAKRLTESASDMKEQQVSLWDEHKNNNNGDRVAAAVQIARGLMAGDPETFKAGYTAENAFLAVCDLVKMSDEPLSTDERNQVAFALSDTPSMREVAAEWEKGNAPEPNPEDEVEA